PLAIESPNVLVRFSPDGKFVLTYGMSAVGRGAVQPWYVDDYTRPWLRERYRIGAYGKVLAREDIEAVAFSPDGRTFLTSGGGKTRLWDVATGNPLGVPLPHDSLGVAFHPNGRTFLSRSPPAVPDDMRTLQLWESAGGGPRPLWTADLIGFTSTVAGMGTG